MRLFFATSFALRVSEVPVFSPICLPDIHAVRKVLHLQFRPRRTTSPGDDEGRDGQRPGADVGYSAG